VIVTSNKNGIDLHTKNTKKYIFPNPYHQPKEYIEKLLALGDEYRDYTLIPTSDSTVEILSKNKKRLEKTYRLTVPDWKVLQYCVIKDKTFQVAEKLNIPYPRTHKLHDISILEDISKEIKYPCIIKGSTKKEREYIPGKVLEIKNKNELIKFGEYVLSRNIHPIVQEKIIGPPSNLIALGSIIDYDYEPSALFVVKKIRQIPYMFGVGTLTESTWDSTVVRQGLDFLREIKYTGISHIEFKYDPQDGKYKLIEINPRSWLHILLTPYCGLNFPQILYRVANGEKVKPMSYRHGIKWHALSSDFVVLLMNVKLKNSFFSFRDYLTSFRGKRVFAVLSGEDPGPMIQDIKNYLLDFVKKS